uniref:Uncharacterized protein n=1 Tax=Arundo donax TaxID=35708 RepID=A0A0A9BC30_ARUDO
MPSPSRSIHCRRRAPPSAAADELH